MIAVLSKKFKHDPLAGKLVLEASWLLRILNRIKNEDISHERFVLGRQSAPALNSKIDRIIAQTEAWRRELKEKIIISPGNKHVYDCYHPEFQKTYKFKPSYLPDDYKSNFFFEVKVKEMCPYTTLIGFHPFSISQSTTQDARTLAQLTKVDINVDTRSRIGIDRADNIAGFRIHGPRESKSHPGSYIMIYGGHHRMRALFKKYLIGEVDGNLKVLVQLVPIKHFSMSKHELLAFIDLEIKNRHKIRKKAYSW